MCPPIDNIYQYVAGKDLGFSSSLLGLVSSKRWKSRPRGSLRSSHTDNVVDYSEPFYSQKNRQTLLVLLGKLFLPFLFISRVPSSKSVCEELPYLQYNLSKHPKNFPDGSRRLAKRKIESRFDSFKVVGSKSYINIL